MEIYGRFGFSQRILRSLDSVEVILKHLLLLSVKSFELLKDTFIHDVILNKYFLRGVLSRVQWSHRAPPHELSGLPLGQH